jgi:thiamine-phosphate pyrophosphorylase
MTIRSGRTLAPRLCLFTPAIIASQERELAATLADILAQVDVAAILLQTINVDEDFLSGLVKPIAAAVQPAGAALLLDGHAALVAPTAADGAHFTGLDALAKGLSWLKPNYIVGAGGLHSRHDAMTAGEAGADYVMFGEPDADGRRLSGAAALEQIAWWSELFEVPCVAYTDEVDQIDAFAAAGADFISLGAGVFGDWRRLKAAAARLAEAAV